jgi:hypothetical protein
MPLPLMPKATAVWLVENTILTFEQIGELCGLHPLEVKGIADEEVAIGIQAVDPLSNGQLTQEEIERCSNDPSASLKLAESDIPKPRARTAGPKYTPVTKRQERPAAIMWLLRYHPELSDAQVGRIVGTTKPTITSVRDRTHWNISNIKPNDPVSLGMCTQAELDENVTKARQRQTNKNKKIAREREKAGLPLLPVETPAATAMESPFAQILERRAEISAESLDAEALQAGLERPPTPVEAEPVLTAEDVFGKKPESSDADADAAESEEAPTE